MNKIGLNFWCIRAHSLPEANRSRPESRNRCVQSWGEPYNNATPVCDDPDACGRHSCHHNPCQQQQQQQQNSFTNRSGHSHSHHSPCRSVCSRMGSCQCRLPVPSPAAQSVQPVAKKSLDKLTPPLSTRRLKATRQRTKNAVCSILDQGEVCLEFIKMRNGGERVVDVCRISSDGMRVRL